MTEYSTQPQTSSYLSRESRQIWSLFYIFTCVGNQASGLCNRPQPVAQPPSPSSELKQLPHPKTDHNRLHLPKDFTSRHTQKHKLSCLLRNCLFQSKLVKPGRGARSLRNEDADVKNQGSWKQMNMTPPKETNKSNNTQILQKLTTMNCQRM